MFINKFYYFYFKFGIDNKLSKKDIETAYLIVICADVSLRESERFAGKKTYDSATEVFIKDAQGALAKAKAYFIEIYEVGFCYETPFTFVLGSLII